MPDFNQLVSRHDSDISISDTIALGSQADLQQQAEAFYLDNLHTQQTVVDMALQIIRTVPEAEAKTILSASPEFIQAMGDDYSRWEQQLVALQSDVAEEGMQLRDLLTGGWVNWLFGLLVVNDKNLDSRLVEGHQILTQLTTSDPSGANTMLGNSVYLPSYTETMDILTALESLQSALAAFYKHPKKFKIKDFDDIIALLGVQRKSEASTEWKASVGSAAAASFITLPLIILSAGILLPTAIVAFPFIANRISQAFGKNAGKPEDRGWTAPKLLDAVTRIQKIRNQAIGTKSDIKRLAEMSNVTNGLLTVNYANRLLAIYSELLKHVSRGIMTAAISSTVAH